jgi:atrazine chlorohydrolase/5-methylthioadenosine/S-adenosylhomocysteine deaminase/melamine deaminase
VSRIAITGGRVLTMDPERRVLEPGTVVVEDQFIAGVGAPGDVDTAGAEVIDARGTAVLPGFVNTHTHVPQILLRGGASHDRGLLDWLFNVLYPGLAAYSDEDIRVGTLLYCAEALRAGITTVVDNEDVRPGDFARAGAAGIGAFTEAGIRAIYARMYFDAARPELDELAATLRARSPGVIGADQSAGTDHVLADLDRLIRTHDGAAGGRIRVWPGPAIPFMVSEKGMRAAQQIAAERTGGWTMHVSEDPVEARVHWMNAPEYLHDLGCLDHRLLAAHCVHVDSRDVRLFRQHDVKVSTQPVSNSYLAAGVAPVPELLANGVCVGIGTDDANCNDSVNLISDMKVLALLHRAVHRDASVVTPEKILEMATIDGARCIGMDGEIGSLEVGKRADIVTLDLRHPQTVPAHDLAATIVFQAYGNEVDTVLVDGAVVMRGRVLSFLPTPAAEAALLRDAGERADAILARSGIAGSRAWRRLGA